MGRVWPLSVDHGRTSPIELPPFIAFDAHAGSGGGLGRSRSIRRRISANRARGTAIPTRLGRPQWNRNHIKSMLKNETYAGTRYFNRITAATEASREGRQVIRGRWVYRDRAEWIPVNVPAIVPRELFETVHEKLRLHEERYCRPVTHHLLQGLVQCGVCGSRCSSSRRYHKVVRPSGRLSVYHRAMYRCNRRAQENMHDRTRIERCRNAEIGTHILEGKVFEMIREIMLDPGKLRCCIDGALSNDQSIARELARIAGEIKALEEERRRIIGRYAAEQMAGEAYLTANRALDSILELLTHEKAELVAAFRSPLHEDFVDASMRQFCASANARYRNARTSSGADCQGALIVVADATNLVAYLC